MSRENGFSISRWWSVVLKEFLQLRRDRVTFAMIVGIPILQMTLFGYAINTKVEHIPTAYYDEDRGQVAIQVLNALRASQDFDLVREATSRQQLEAPTRRT